MKSTIHRTPLIVAAITVIVLTSLHTGLTAQPSTHSAYRWWYWLKPGVYAKYALITVSGSIVYLEWRVTKVMLNGFIVNLSLLQGGSVLKSVEVFVDSHGYMHNVTTGRVIGVWTLLRDPSSLVPGHRVELCLKAPLCPLQTEVINASKSGYVSFYGPFMKLLMYRFSLDIRRLVALDVFLWHLVNETMFLHRMLSRCPGVNKTSLYLKPPGLPSLEEFLKRNRKVFIPLCTGTIYDSVTGLAIVLTSGIELVMQVFSCFVDDVFYLLNVSSFFMVTVPFGSSIQGISLGTYIKLLNLSIEQAARILGVSPSVLRSELNRFHSSGLLVSTNVFKVFRERVRVVTVSVSRGAAPVAVSTWVAVGVGVAIVIGVVVTIYAVRRRR